MKKVVLVGALPLTFFGTLLLLLMVDELTPLDIDSLELWLGISAVVLVAGVWHIRKVQQSRVRIIRFGFLFALFIGVKLLSWRGGWQTDTIEYQHRASANRTIEFQLMNPGVGSYRRRRVDRIWLLPGVSWTREVADQNIDPQVWQRVDIEVNEMGLKYP